MAQTNPYNPQSQAQQFIAWNDANISNAAARTRANALAAQTPAPAAAGAPAASSAATATFHPNGTASPAGTFVGSGVSQYSVLGITEAQAAKVVQLTGGTPNAPLQPGLRDTNVSQGQTPPQADTIANVLAQFRSAIDSDSAYAATMAQELSDAGLMTSTVYNNGGPSSTIDIYNAYKQAVLGAQSTGKPIDQYIQGAVSSYQAQGGTRLKLPNIRYTATLTSVADVQTAGDAVFERLLGRRMTPGELAAIHGTLNQVELSSRQTEAQSAYEQLLGYRNLSDTGQPLNSGTAPANTAVAADVARANGQPVPVGTPAQTGAVGASVTNGVPTPITAAQAAAPTVGGAALPQIVTNATGGNSTVVQGPTVVPYQQPATSESQAYSYAMANDQPEIQGRNVAAAMDIISQALGGKA